MPAQHTDEAAIVASNVSKTFVVAKRREGLLGGLRTLVAPEREARTVLHDVSFSVRQGELVSFLGPNGAGKSTMIKVMTGITWPTSGQVLVAGRKPTEDRSWTARTVGVVFGQRTQLWWDLPARESLAILRDIFDVPDAAYRRRLAEFDEVLELSSFWDNPVRQLSLGQRVRCDLAAALLHEPRIVFLDEPTIGMDVIVKEQVRRFLLREVEQRGCTVVLTTHDMTEVAQLSRRVVLIDGGRLVFDGALTDLAREYGSPPLVHLTFSEPVADLTVPDATVVSHAGMKATIRPDRGAATRDVVRGLFDRLPVADLSIEEHNLEDVVREFYRGSARAAEAVQQ